MALFSLRGPAALSRPAFFVLALGLLSFSAGCQKEDKHPPFLPGCEEHCAVLPGIEIGVPGAGGSTSTPVSDAGPGSLTGQVLLLDDDSFVHASLYINGATVTADGANGSPVSTDWDGADPYELDGVAREATNWVSVKPELVGGDPQLTYQAVATTSVNSVNLAVVSGATLDGVFNAVSSIRSPNFGQVVLFFRSAGTGAALSGLHVAMAKADVAAYRSTATWVLDDGTAVTDQSGLVVFGNVDPANSAGTQIVTVTKAATSGSAAIDGGQFSVKVVQGAVTIATVNVSL